MRHENRQRPGGSTQPGERSNALWGSGKKLTLTLATLVVALIAIAAGRVETAQAERQPAYLSPGLLADATAHPQKLFDVIVQERRRGADKGTSATVVDGIQSEVKDRPAKGSRLLRRFASI